MEGRSYKNFKGAIFLGDQQVAETQMCCHCGLHFIKKFDKTKLKLRNLGGHVRSVCLLCDGETCGRKVCNQHNPLLHPVERWIENVEKQNT